MKHKIINVGLIGLGRIGKMHAENICYKLPFLNLKSISDPKPDHKFIQNLGEITVHENAQEIISDKNIDAVIISSPTPTHFSLIKKCLENNKHVFCEKPISFSEEEVIEIIDLMAIKKTFVQVGLNRRFDEDFILLKEKIKEGLIGKTQMIHITNHDSTIPRFKFLKSSGGMLFDLCIHDFDMVTFITGEKIKEIYVNGSVFIEPRLKDVNDIDNAIITLELTNGVLCTIDSSRQTHFGYDQRIEVFGSKGMISIDNKPNQLFLLSDESRTVKSKIRESFVERYQSSYINELEHFYKCVISDKSPIVGPENILDAIRIASAGTKSLEVNRPIMVKR
jgi:myo-inositol 2-dehydrogenase/D-chiro-inositol 1-dehydrogenase